MRDLKDSELSHGEFLHRADDWETHVFQDGADTSLCGKELTNKADAHRCSCRACIERYRDKYESVSRGDRVQFVDVHHAMNDHLKNAKGQKGSVDMIHNTTGEARVHFDDMVGHSYKWWINTDRLEVVEKFDQAEESEEQ